MARVSADMVSTRLPSVRRLRARRVRLPAASAAGILLALGAALLPDEAVRALVGAGALLILYGLGYADGRRGAAIEALRRG